MTEYNDFNSFRNSFNLDENVFQNITQHANPDRLGFSAYILPTEELKRKLNIESGFEYRTLFAVYFNKFKSTINNLQPLVVRMVFALYDDNNSLGDYILDYSHIKNIKKVPVDIYDDDNYFFDINNIKICDKNGSEINTSHEFNKMYNYHTKLSKGINSSLFSLKTFFYRTLPQKIYMKAIKIFNFILYFFAREKIESKVLNFNILNEVFPSEKNKTLTKTEEVSNVDFFGLKVKYVPLFTYSLLHIIGYFIFYYFKIFPNWIKQILEYNFLTVIYVLTSYFLYTSIPAKLLTPVIEWLYRKYNIISKLVIKP